MLVASDMFRIRFQKVQLRQMSDHFQTIHMASLKIRSVNNLSSCQLIFHIVYSGLDCFIYGKDRILSQSSQLDAAIDNGDDVFNMSGGVEQLRDYLPIEGLVQQLYDLHKSETKGTFTLL